MGSRKRPRGGKSYLFYRVICYFTFTPPTIANVSATVILGIITLIVGIVSMVSSWSKYLPNPQKPSKVRDNKAIEIQKKILRRLDILLQRSGKPPVDLETGLLEIAPPPLPPRSPNRPQVNARRTRVKMP